MSADARVVRKDGPRDWLATHDGPCAIGAPAAHRGQLSEVIIEAEMCLGTPLGWEIETMRDGTPCLVGWAGK